MLIINQSRSCIPAQLQRKSIVYNVPVHGCFILVPLFYPYLLALSYKHAYFREPIIVDAT